MRFYDRSIFLFCPDRYAGASAFGAGGRGGRVTFEKRLHQIFVNPSLIISTELENKSPGDDAEPEMMPGGF